MEKWLMVVGFNCKEESKEEEFNLWYDDIHIPDVLEGCSHFKKVTRYTNPDQNSQNNGKYLAVFEIETPDINETLSLHGKNMERVKSLGRLSGFFERKFRHICKIDPML